MEMILVVLFIGVLLVVLLVSSHVKKKRAEAMERVAGELEFSYIKEGDSQMVSSLGRFYLFSKGRRKRVDNLLHGQFEGMDVSIFDYRYTIGGGKHSHTHRQTVMIFQSGSLKLPEFFLRPENLFHKIGGALGYQDIDFDGYEKFSKNYLLRGKDEQAVRETFNESILSYYEFNGGLSTEGDADTIIIYRASKKVSPEEIKTFYDMGYDIFNLFTAAANS